MVAIEHLITQGRELRQMKTQLDQASALKVGGVLGGVDTPTSRGRGNAPPLSPSSCSLQHLEQRSALLQLYEWTANLKLPAVEYVWGGGAWGRGLYW